MNRYNRRRRYCRFTAEGIKEIDYKDVGHAASSSSARPARSFRRAPPERRPAISVSWRWL